MSYKKLVSFLKWPKEYWLAGLVFIGGCLLSLVFYRQLQTIDDKRLNEHFVEVTQKQVSHLQWNLTSYSNALHSVVDLFSSEKRVEIEKFHSIARVIRRRYPEILALEWLPRVDGDERESFEREIQARYGAPFEIKELDLEGELRRASEREKYYPVTFVEPFANATYNQNYLGFDHFSMQSRRQIIQRARDQGSITATPALIFPRVTTGKQQIQSPNNNLGIILYKPVFRGDVSSTDTGVKHEKPVGVLAQLLRIQSVIGPVFAESGAYHNIAVFEQPAQTQADEERLIYTNRRPPQVIESIQDSETKIEFRKQMPVLNHKWTVYVWPTELYLYEQRSWAPTLALSLGLLITVVFSFASYRFSGKFIGNRKKFRSVIESAEDAIITLDDTGLIRLWNPAAENIFGYDSNAIVGKPFDEIISSDDGKDSGPVGPLMDKEEANLPGETVELIGCRKDGSKFPVDVTVSSWEQLGERYFTFIIRDITERKNKEEKLRELNENLEKKVKARTEELEQFVYAASHDLREPARVMQTYAGFLEEDLAEDNEENIKKDLEFIRSSASEMSQLIDSLLKLSRISSGELQRELTSVEECVDSACEQVELDEKVSNLSISHEQLPKVEADPALLVDLYRNLIANALKHAMEDGELKILFTARKEPEAWVLGVKDDGPGIDPEFHDTIFKPFKHLRTEKQESSGIGLSICRRIVERHNGEIWVESDPGEGAHFQFSIPFSET